MLNQTNSRCTTEYWEFHPHFPQHIARSCLLAECCELSASQAHGVKEWQKRIQPGLRNAPASINASATLCEGRHESVYSLIHRVLDCGTWRGLELFCLPLLDPGKDRFIKSDCSNIRFSW